MSLPHHVALKLQHHLGEIQATFKASKVYLVVDGGDAAHSMVMGDADPARIIDLIVALDGQALAALSSRTAQPGGWQDISTQAPPTDGTKFDAWCVHPRTGTMGVRFTDVQMRGDMSGFGFVYHTEAGAQWQYLEIAGPIYAAFHMTHWQPLPPAPTTSRSEASDVE